VGFIITYIIVPTYTDGLFDHFADPQFLETSFDINWSTVWHTIET